MQLYNKLIAVLKKENSFITDHGELKKWVVISAAQNGDERLIELLLADDELKQTFFKPVAGTMLFLQNNFLQFAEQKMYLKDSYTAYRNKVGLTIGGKFFNQRNEVELVWPYKDCILEGGQTREEQKRDEIFFNQTLAQDEITKLLDPKVLTNAKRYNADGVDNKIKFHRNADGTITDNLIIKGNNLLALHTLKKKFAGRVKLIYIDPPYNTGSKADTFLYNNTFKRSSWLVFMKNRLEVSKQLLSKEGVLIVAIDEHEHSHLGVLLEEMFQDHEIHCITIVHNPRGVQGSNFSYTNEYAFFVIPKGRKTIIDRKISDDEIEWSNLRNWGSESERSDAKNCFYPIYVNKKDYSIVNFGKVSDDDYHPNSTNVINGDIIEVYPIDSRGIERKWRYARQTVESIKNLLRAREKNGVVDIELGKNFGQYKTVWVDPKYDANEYGTKIIKDLVPNCPFSFPKSLYNVYDCLYSVVGKDKTAIVLDFFGGSGTTAHAVLELNKNDDGSRQFILCEQLNYIETVTVERLKKVINNNQNGSFIYLELKKYNQAFIERIEATKNTKELLKIWDEMKEKSFLTYNIDLKNQNAAIEEFKTLTLQQQKQTLCELLDKNQLYVNLSELDNKDFACTKEEKTVTRAFYNMED